MLNESQVEEAVRMTFEEMAFLDVVAGTDPMTSLLQEGPWLFLAYTRPKSGSFALFLPKATRYAVAEAIYGEDRGEVTSTQLDDSLLELMNVLVGRLLTRRFGVGTAYSMGLPTVLFDFPGDIPGFSRKVFPFHNDENEMILIWYEVPA